MDISFKFRLPSNTRYLAVVRATVGELAAVYGFTDRDSCRLTLAVDEALANVIRHAYHGDPDRQIEVDCRVAGDLLEFTLVDQGEPPDPARLAPHPLDDVALSGRGTHIIRSIMDEVRYEKVPAGNLLRLSKRLPADTAGSGEKEAREEGKDI